MTRWVRPPELARSREREQFDPVAEGARHGLSRELSLSIWEQVRADATNRAGRCDIEQARRQFQQLAARIGTRRGGIQSDIGKVTRVGVEIDGDSRMTRSFDDALSRGPGRETLVTVEARRRVVSGESSMVGEASRIGQALVAGKGAGETSSTRESRPLIPDAADVPSDRRSLAITGSREMDALQVSARPEPGPSPGNRMSRLFGFGLARIVDREHGAPWPAAQDDQSHIDVSLGTPERDAANTAHNAACRRWNRRAGTSARGIRKTRDRDRCHA